MLHQDSTQNKDGKAVEMTKHDVKGTLSDRDAVTDIDVGSQNVYIDPVQERKYSKQIPIMPHISSRSWSA